MTFEKYIAKRNLKEGVSEEPIASSNPELTAVLGLVAQLFGPTAISKIAKAAGQAADSHAKTQRSTSAHNQDWHQSDVFTAIEVAAERFKPTV